MTSFGASGTDVVLGLAHQNDGSLVAVGYSDASSQFDFAIARYDSSGVLDPTFGTGGRVTTDFGGSDLATAVTVQPDGRIVVVGRSGNAFGISFAIARYQPNGALDAAFGTGGMILVRITPSSIDRASAVALQADGSILVAGDTFPGGGEPLHWAVVRFTPNGALDPAFGSGGKKVVSFGFGATDFATAIAVQPDQSIVVGGSSLLFGGSWDFGVARLLPNGSLDPGFGSAGLARADILQGSDDQVSGLVLQADGRIVLAGTTRDAPSVQNGDFVLVRWNMNGAIDGSFGGAGNGIARTTFGSGSEDSGLALAQQNGKLLVAGFTTASGTRDFALARFTTAGLLDPTFGTAATGRVTTPFGGASDETAYAISVSPAGRPVAAGSTTQNGTSDFALARYDAPCAPTAPVSAPTAVCPAATLEVQVADAGPGATYAWTSGNAFIVGGQGTRRVKLAVGSIGLVSVSVTVQTATCTSNGGAAIPIDSVSCQGALSYYTLNPCRIFDTRPPSGTSLVAGSSRVFTVAGLCGVPADAKAVTANATVLYPTATGNLRFYANGAPTPSASVNAYTPGTTRANILQLSLGTNGEIRLDTVQPAGTADAILDVSGYFK